MLFAAGAGIYNGLFGEEVYLASATITIPAAPSLPGRTESSMSPRGRQLLLESERVRFQLEHRLKSRGIIAEDAVLERYQLHSSLTTPPAEAAGWEPATLVATVRANSPERAAAIANEWCTTFRKIQRQMVVATATSILKTVEVPYQKNKDELEAAETNRSTRATELQHQLDDQRLLWAKRIAAHEQRTSDLFAAERAASEDAAVDTAAGSTAPGSAAGGAGGIKLQGDRALQLVALENQRIRELEQLQRARRLELKRLEREVKRLGDLESRLVQLYNDATYLRALAETDEVFVAAAAVPAPKPLPNRRIARVLISAIVGMLLAAVLAIWIERGMDRATGASG